MPQSITSTFETFQAGIPSITTWTRLEPLPREGSMARSLQAQVRDPLWMLGRQWQVGEFRGDDAGSPVQATMSVDFRTITTYRPGANGAAVPYDLALPLETHVEREAFSLKLRGSVQFGLYFEGLLLAGGIANVDAVIKAFRSAFPIASADPDPLLAGAGASAFRRAVAGSVTDGETLYASVVAVRNGQPPPVPLPAEATLPAVMPLLDAFVKYHSRVYNQPDHDPAWQKERLDYRFAIGSPLGADTLTLEAAEFTGGHLDWYAFTFGQGSQTLQNPQATSTTQTFNFLPQHVTFRGMPEPRWWSFEDGITDFGQLDVEHVDLAKMLVMEFALIYGTDWFSVPVPTPIGTISHVSTFVVTDTFGQRTYIRPAEDTTVVPNKRPWSMFKLTGDGALSDFILLAPTIGSVDTADLENVLFLRDDMAAMAWAVEQQVHGELDAPVDAYELYLARVAANPPPDPPNPKAGGPDIYYTLERPVPDNWIPLVPVITPTNEPYLRRGTMVIPTKASFLEIAPRSDILDPQNALFITDRTVATSGVRVRRYYRRTRWTDGSTFVWVARVKDVGRGPGWSGLRFDIVEHMSTTTPVK